MNELIEDVSKKDSTRRHGILNNDYPARSRSSKEKFQGVGHLCFIKVKR